MRKSIISVYVRSDLLASNTDRAPKQRKKINGIVFLYLNV